MRYAIILACILVAPRLAMAQTCQSITGVAYGSYTDAAGQTQSLLLDMLLPAAATSPTPVVVWIHGGGWRTGSRSPMPTRAANLCPRGYAVATIDYRLTGVARWPAQMHDIRAAVRWVRAQAAQYNLDASRIAAWGNSAGGHLAAMLATTGGVRTVTVGSVNVDLEGTVGGNLQYSSRVQAAVSWYPLTDFLHEQFYPMNRDVEGSGTYEGGLLGGKIQDRPELAATANPVAYATADDPPLLTMHGTADTVAPFNQSELLVDALLDEGVDAELYTVQGAAHSASYFDRTTHLTAVYAFLDRVLANPTVPPPPPSPPPVSASGVRVEATDATATETGDRGQFRVTRAGNPASALTVTLAVSGTATDARDYSHLQRTITIPAGSASATFDVVPLEDDLRESSETAIVTIAASSAYALGTPRSGSVVIKDNDNTTTRPTVSLSATDRQASESGGNTGAFMITRTGSTTNALTVGIQTGGRATPGLDYASVPATVTFASGLNRVTLPIAPLSDSNTEGLEDVTLSVVLSSAIYVGPYERGFVAIIDSVPDPPPSAPLPAGWQSRDIGSVGVSGSASESGGVFTVRGGGADVWGTADAFHFAYRTVSGDATVVARVASISGTQAWTKIGVMIRASTSASAAHAFMLVSVGKGLAFQRRTVSGATSTHTSGGTGTAPRWVRLARTGSVIVASVSQDGSSWTEVGRDSFTIPETVLIGLAAHSHDTSRLASGTFDIVTVR